jgi:RNA polymerase sigma-70 factor (ECF subfamily)
MADDFIRRGLPGNEEAAVADTARVLAWPEDEAGLMSELRSGSEPAFDWLVTHYHRPVFGLIAGMLSDPSEAADVTQEVFLRAFRGIGSFREGSSLKTWLYRIAVRQALNHRRWSWRHLRQQSSIDTDLAENENGHAELESPGASAFDELASREVQQAVRGALAKVAENFRTAVILRDLEGMSYEEIAEVMEISVGTVKSRILRGRRALRDLLEPMFAPGRVVR